MPGQETLHPAWEKAEPPVASLPRRMVAARSKVDNYHVVPLVKVHEGEDAWHFWDEIPVEQIVVDYFSLRNTGRLYRPALEEGLHRALNFPGRITVMLVGKDWELDKLDVVRYARDLQKMKPDAVSTPDDYTYVTDLPNYRMGRILRALDRTQEIVSMLPGMELVGIVKGSTEKEIEFHVERLMAFGIKKMAFPCSGYMKAKRYTEPMTFVRICRDKELLSWIVGANSLGAMRRLGADCYSGSGWCYAPVALGMIYGRRKWVKVESARFQCSHSECQATQDLHLPSAAKARHNVRSLLDLDEELRGRTNLG